MADASGVPPIPILPLMNDNVSVMVATVDDGTVPEPVNMDGLPITTSFAAPTPFLYLPKRLPEPSIIN